MQGASYVLGEQFRFRVAAVGVVGVALLVSLLARLWYLQGLSASRYERLAESNRIREIYIPAPRGRILDRNGKDLVGNRSAYAITVDPTQLPPASSRSELAARLSALLSTRAVPVWPDEIAKKLEEAAGQLAPIVIAEDVPREKIIYLYEHRDEFQGVEAEIRAVREYALGPGGGGPLAPHVLGYVAPVTKELLEEDASYSLADKVGRAGVEQQYDKVLRGEAGRRSLEVTSKGKVVGEVEYKPPVRGSDVVLTIDSDVQWVVEESLAEVAGGVESMYNPLASRTAKLKGAAAVVLDPQTGEIIAIASHPSFDLRAIAAGISQKDWERLNDPALLYPLQNRALQGQYPPASTLKPVLAAAAIQEGMITPQTTFACPGKYVVPGDLTGKEFKDWTKSGHGYPDLAKAIAQSCDVYFYNLGWMYYQRYRQTGQDVMQQDLREFGLGTPTGVDLPGEQPGRVPDPAWKLRVNNNDPNKENSRWYPGDNINMSVGQGDLLVTPIQLAQAYAALAGGGKVFKPHIMLRVVGPDGSTVAQSTPEVARSVSLSPETLRSVEQYLAGVVQGGTAAKAFVGWPHSQVPVGGKTGTAEIKGKRDNSLFVGVGPLNNPRWVVAVIVEGGGHGSEAAAPVARRIMEVLAKVSVSNLSQVVASSAGSGGD
ncbi:MAG: penicillin-binding protein 2 [Acidimicrobiia bacterium]